MGERDPAEYTVEINGAECRVCLHYDCLKKVIGEYFSRPPLIYNVTQEKANEFIKTWEPRWTADNTVNHPPPDTTRVWCKNDDGSTHTPWKDRVD